MKTFISISLIHLAVTLVLPFCLLTLLIFLHNYLRTNNTTNKFNLLRTKKSHIRYNVKSSNLHFLFQVLNHAAKVWHLPNHTKFSCFLFFQYCSIFLINIISYYITIIYKFSPISITLNQVRIFTHHGTPIPSFHFYIILYHSRLFLTKNCQICTISPLESRRRIQCPAPEKRRFWP